MVPRWRRRSVCIWSGELRARRSSVPDAAFRYPSELGPRRFPAPGTVGHAALLLVDAAAIDGSVDPERTGWRLLSRAAVLDKLSAWGRRIGSGRGGWATEDVESPELLAGKIAALLTGLDLLRIRPAGIEAGSGGESADVWLFSPVTGRWLSAAVAGGELHGR